MKQEVTTKRRPLSRPMYQDALDAASAIRGRPVELRELAGFVRGLEETGRIASEQLREERGDRRAELWLIRYAWSRRAADLYRVRRRLSRAHDHRIGLQVDLNSAERLVDYKDRELVRVGDRLRRESQLHAGTKAALHASARHVRALKRVVVPGVLGAGAFLGLVLEHYGGFL